METDDSGFEAKLKQAGGKLIPVVITCGDDCDSVKAALEEAGVQITSTESMIVGSIAARITAEQLEVVDKVPGVQAVEYDEPATALE